MNAYRKIYKPLLLKETMMGRGPIYALAQLLTRYAGDREAERRALKGYNDAAIPNIKALSETIPSTKSSKCDAANSLEAPARSSRVTRQKKAMGGAAPSRPPAATSWEQA